MARGVTRSIETRIADLDKKIQKKQGELKALQSQRKELLEVKKNEVAFQIAQLAIDKGVSLDEIVAWIESR
jgi:ribosome maturation protein Sdo1